MAPRKRVKVSPSPAPQSSPAAASPSKVEEELLNDPWTDEEEVGIHKHFRLLALHQYLLSNRYIHPANEHTKLPGIWTKLASLYDLEALDDREDARQLSDISVDGEDEDDNDGDADVYSLAANKIHTEDFRLPDDDFGDLKWYQRFAPDEERRRRGASSPPLLPELNLAEHPPVCFTPSFSIEPSEAPTPNSRAVGRKKASAREKRQIAPPMRRSTRQAESTAEDDGDEGEGEEDDEDEGDGDGQKAEEDDDQEVQQSASEADTASEKESTPARSTRASGRNAAKSRGGGSAGSTARSRARAGGK